MGKRQIPPEKPAEIHEVPLRDALEVWKDVSFNYESTDSPDFAPTATPAT